MRNSTPGYNRSQSMGEEATMAVETEVEKAAIVEEKAGATTTMAQAIAPEHTPRLVILPPNTAGLNQQSPPPDQS